MHPIATLPMYDFPSVRSQTDLLWLAIAKELRNAGFDAPGHLTRVGDLWSVWRDPDMILAQTCGYPYVKALKDQVQLVGTPDYGVVEGYPGWYDSVVVCRLDDPRQSLGDFSNAKLAFNDHNSQSGFIAIMYMLHSKFGDTVRFHERVETQSHQNSAILVADGQADITSIDCITWFHLCRENPDHGLRVLARTNPTPGLPFITSKKFDATLIADAVHKAIAGLPGDTKTKLGIVGFWRSEPADYNIISKRAQSARILIDLHFPNPNSVN